MKDKMVEQFVTYEIALKLKELGFDEQCICRYNAYEVLKHTISGTNPDMDDYVSSNKYDDRLLAPLYQQVIDWFRDVYKIHISIIPFNDEEGEQILYEFVIHEFDWNDISDYTYYHSNREAREAAILKAIGLCQKINQIE